MTDYREPLTTEDLQAWVDYTEQVGQVLMAESLKPVAIALPNFPATAIERARFEIARRSK
jgi:hypothetical protein